ncbi:MAG: adenine phosphoribosyltransferase [Verrucomicrobiota bacterium]
MNDPQPIHDAIRDIPDFPKPGIVFKDITPVLAEPQLLSLSITLLADTAGAHHIDKVVGIDARGFIFGAAVAERLNAGFVPLRKAGKLPYETHSTKYALEYGEAEIEIHTDAIAHGENVLLVDDLLATGGTAAAAVELIHHLGGNLVAASFLIELAFLNGREKLPADLPVHGIVDY